MARTKFIVFLNAERHSGEPFIAFYYDYYGKAKYTRREALKFARHYSELEFGAKMHRIPRGVKYWDTVTAEKMQAIADAYKKFENVKITPDKAPIFKALNGIIATLGCWHLVNN